MLPIVLRVCAVLFLLGGLATTAIGSYFLFISYQLALGAGLGMTFFSFVAFLLTFVRRKARTVSLQGVGA